MISKCNKEQNQIPFYMLKIAKVNQSHNQAPPYVFKEWIPSSCLSYNTSFKTETNLYTANYYGRRRSKGAVREDIPQYGPYHHHKVVVEEAEGWRCKFRVQFHRFERQRIAHQAIEEGVEGHPTLQSSSSSHSFPSPPVMVMACYLSTCWVMS